MRADPAARPAASSRSSGRRCAVAQDDARTPSSPTLCEGWDGRRVRKLVLAALALRPSLAASPEDLSADDLRTAVEAAVRHGSATTVHA